MTYSKNIPLYFMINATSQYMWLIFFSSRRRHTRWPRDWSSDVCSSDLSRTGLAGKLQAGDVFTDTDGMQCDFQAGLVRRDGGADFQHVGAQHLVPRAQVISVVLHKGSTTFFALAHYFHDPVHGRGLPVTFAAVAVAFGHQPLGGHAGQTGQAGEVFEVVSKAFEAAFFQAALHADFQSRFVFNHGHLVLWFEHVGGYIVTCQVFLNQRVGVRIADSINHGGQLTQTKGVHFIAEVTLGSHFIAFGYRYLPHVVTKSGHFQGLSLGPTHSYAQPIIDFLLNALLLPMANDHTTILAQTGADVAELPVTVGTLVQVHVIHVDFGPGQLGVELGVQMHVRLIERLQAGNPHFGRGERVHPKNQTDTVAVIIGALTDGQNFLGGFNRRLGDDFGRQFVRGGQTVGNFLAVRRNLL